MGKAIWFSPAQINFNRYQIEFFLLPNLIYLRQGIWPPEGKTTGYIKNSNKPVYRSGTYSEKIVDIAAELDARMALIGKLSKVLELIYTLNKEPFQVARDYKITEEDLTYHCRKMLKFISGWKRKRESYQDWLNLSNIKRFTMAIS